MSRVLIAESAQSTLRTLKKCLGSLGYDLCPVGAQERMKLEIRAQEPSLLIVSAEMFGESGLETVSGLYLECESPVPVIVYSTQRSPSALLDVVPFNLNLGALLRAPLDPSELVESVVSLLPPPNPGAAKKLLAQLRAENATRGLELEPPTGALDLSVESVVRALWAVHENGWSGRFAFDAGGNEGIDWYFVDGRLTHAETQRGRDLVETAAQEGRIDLSSVPDVVLATQEEQLGLLMAYRAIGMHEAESLQQRTIDRLLIAVLSRNKGTMKATEGEQSEHKVRVPLRIPRLVLRLYSEHSEDLQGGSFQPQRDAIARIRLPGDSVVKGWSLETPDAKALQLIATAHSREITYDQLIRLASGGNASDIPRVRCLTGTLLAVGYIAFHGGPWDDETSEKIERLVKVLHEASRGNYFEVLGLDVVASEKDIRARNRELARKYHPDTMYHEHPRIQRLAESVYARIQEAVTALLNKETRSAVRQELQQRNRVGSTTGAAEPKKALVALKQGELYLRNKAYDEAEVFFRDATLLDPENPDGFVLLGWSRFLQDPSTTSEASKAIETAIKLNPRHPDAWYYLGRIALLRKDPERARRRFQKALNFDPNHVGAARETRLIERRSETDPNRRKVPRPQGLRGLFGRRKDD